MFDWRSWVTSVVFPADSSALASDRNGTRSTYRPALPRSTSDAARPGVQANPTRGDRLLASVSIVSSHCRS